MSGVAAEIARRLGENAEAVCRHYLSNGRREGCYWMVGDIHNGPGRSLYVRLFAAPDGRGSAGKWTDAASGEHGDLLDIIANACGHVAFRETLEEARRFLSLPPPPAADRNRAPPKAPTGTPEAARRLWGSTRPIIASLASRYLAGRAIDALAPSDPLRFHPHCFYRRTVDDAPDTRPAWPAMIAAVTDLDGAITGVHRTWLDPETADKAPVAFPRRAMGHLLGNGVRFGRAARVMAAGEGLETILSLRQLLPSMPMIAGLSAAHLGALAFPADLERLYVARDDDPAGDGALAAIGERAAAAGIDVLPLEPARGDFNGDLMTLGPQRLGASLRNQLVGPDRLLLV
ncbi:DUF7146 domain-containing protein [Sphingopyxis granuli]|uniref:DNA primase n=1 Tax=Sphingopyxis granuli TaxID=267128 RepID=A0AA86L4L0_9SPHN|nr:toprim domain-containing protein [Sphingopyxis granuli]AMG75578.1 DNA primase [Sphingopyxis granuli]